MVAEVVARGVDLHRLGSDAIEVAPRGAPNGSAVVHREQQSTGLDVVGGDVLREDFPDDIGQRNGPDACGGLGGARDGISRALQISCRSIVTRRRRKSTRSRVRPHASPWRRPRPADVSTSARNRSGTAEAIVCICSTLNGTSADVVLSRRGSFTDGPHGDALMSLSTTAERITATSTR